MPEALIVNPRRGGKAPARGRSGRFKKGGGGRRRNPGEELVIVNGRRSKKQRTRRRRRNPGGFGFIRYAMAGAGGGLGGMAAGFMDAKFLADKPIASALVKTGAAVVGGFALSYVSPSVGCGFAGGMMGSVGYRAGIKLGGGMLVGEKTEDKKKALAALAADDDMAILIREELKGLGVLVTEKDTGLKGALARYAEMSEPT